MVIVDKENKTSIQQPYRPTSKSRSLVVTLPKHFTDILEITSESTISIRLDDPSKSLVIKKVKMI